MNIETRALMSFAINNAVSLSQETAENLLKNLIVKTVPVITLSESSFTSLNLNPRSFFDALAEQPHELDSLSSKTLLVFSHYGLLGKVVRNQSEITDKSAARLAEMLVILLGGSSQPEHTLNDLNLGEKALERIFHSGVLNSKTYNNSPESKAYSKAAFIIVKELYLRERLIFTPQVISFFLKNNIQLIEVMAAAHHECTEPPFEDAVFNFNCLNSTGQNSLIEAIRESLDETIDSITKGLSFVSVDSDLSRALGVKHPVDIVSWCHQLRVTSPVFQLTALKACLDYQMATELSLRYWGDAICHLLDNESLYAEHNASELSKGVLTRYTPLTFSRILDGAQELGCYALLKECLLIERSLNQKANISEPSPMVPFSNLSIDGDNSQQAAKRAYEIYVSDIKPNYVPNKRTSVCHSLKDAGVVPNPHLFKITKDGYSSILYKLRESMRAPSAIPCDEITDNSTPYRVSYMMDMVEYDGEGNLALTDIVSGSEHLHSCESLVINQSYCEALKGALRDGYLDLIFRETPFICHTNKLFASSDLTLLFEEAIKQMIKRRSYAEDASQLYAALQLMFHFDLFDVDYLIDGIGVRDFILNHSPLTSEKFTAMLSTCKESPYHQLSEVTLEHPISGVKPMAKSLSKGSSAGVARSISDGSYEQVVRLADMLNYVQSHGIKDLDATNSVEFLPFFNLSLMAYVIRNKTPIEVLIDGVRGEPCFGESGQEPLSVIQGDSVVESSPILDEDFETLMKANHPHLVESGYEFKNPVLELFSSDNIEDANVSTVGIEELSKHIWESQKATVLKEGGDELSTYGVAKLNNTLLKQKFLELTDTIYVSGGVDWKDLLCAIYSRLWLNTSGTKKYNNNTRGSIDAIGDDASIDVVFVGVDQELAEPIVELGVKFDKHLLQWCFIYLFG